MEKLTRSKSTWNKKRSKTTPVFGIWYRTVHFVSRWKLNNITHLLNWILNLQRFTALFSFSVVHQSIGTSHIVSSSFSANDVATAITWIWQEMNTYRSWAVHVTGNLWRLFGVWRSGSGRFWSRACVVFRQVALFSVGVIVQFRSAIHWLWLSFITDKVSEIQISHIKTFKAKEINLTWSSYWHFEHIGYCSRHQPHHTCWLRNQRDWHRYIFLELDRIGVRLRIPWRPVLARNIKCIYRTSWDRQCCKQELQSWLDRNHNVPHLVRYTFDFQHWKGILCHIFDLDKFLHSYKRYTIHMWGHWNPVRTSHSWYHCKRLCQQSWN